MPVDVLNHLLAALAPLAGVRAERLGRHLHGLYLGTALFGLVEPGRAYFKADQRSVTRYLARGSYAYRPGPRQTLRSFYAVPADVLADPEMLLGWAVDAVRAAREHPGRVRRRVRRAGRRRRGSR